MKTKTFSLDMLFNTSLGIVRTNPYFCVSVFEKLPVNTRMFKKEAYPNKVGFLFLIISSYTTH